MYKSLAFKKYILAIDFISLFQQNKQTMRVMQPHCYDFPKNLVPWRESNPGLLIGLAIRNHYMQQFSVVITTIFCCRVSGCEWKIFGLELSVSLKGEEYAGETF
jgi:hypothetical protein